jgi:MarR family transcriptional regulator, negative regulator of the multidrug operon emrRAB
MEQANDQRVVCLTQSNKLGSMRSDNRTANLLGAFAIALGDAMRAAVEQASRHGLTGSAALVTIATYPGEPLDALRRTLGLSAAGATRLADRLQGDGLIERRADLGDGRSRAVVLTDAGAERARSVLEARRSVLLRALAPLSAEERDELARLLEGMLSALTPDRETCDRTCRLCDLAACPQDMCPVERPAVRAEG